MIFLLSLPNVKCEKIKIDFENVLVLAGRDNWAFVHQKSSFELNFAAGISLVNSLQMLSGLVITRSDI